MPSRLAHALRRLVRVAQRKLKGPLGRTPRRAHAVTHLWAARAANARPLRCSLAWQPRMAGAAPTHALPCRPPLAPAGVCRACAGHPHWPLAARVLRHLSSTDSLAAQPCFGRISGLVGGRSVCWRLAGGRGDCSPPPPHPTPPHPAALRLHPSHHTPLPFHTLASLFAPTVSPAAAHCFFPHFLDALPRPWPLPCVLPLLFVVFKSRVGLLPLPAALRVRGIAAQLPEV